MKKKSERLGIDLGKEIEAIRDYKTGKPILKSKTMPDTIQEEGLFWRSLESLPKVEGTEAILWLTTNKGFPDVSAHCFLKDGSWYWMDTHEVIKRQDLIMGWLPWPEPPQK
jgi:hypothetical protein